MTPSVGFPGRVSTDTGGGTLDTYTCTVSSDVYTNTHPRNLSSLIGPNRSTQVRLTYSTIFALVKVRH